MTLKQTKKVHKTPPKTMNFSELKKRIENLEGTIRNLSNRLDEIEYVQDTGFKHCK